MSIVEIEAVLQELNCEDLAKVEVLSRDLRQSKMPRKEEGLPEAPAQEFDLEAAYCHLGFRPLPKREGPSVTNELVNRIREEEGI